MRRLGRGPETGKAWYWALSGRTEPWVAGQSKTGLGFLHFSPDEDVEWCLEHSSCLLNAVWLPHAYFPGRQYSEGISAGARVWLQASPASNQLGTGYPTSFSFDSLACNVRSAHHPYALPEPLGRFTWLLAPGRSCYAWYSLNSARQRPLTALRSPSKHFGPLALLYDLRQATCPLWASVSPSCEMGGWPEYMTIDRRHVVWVRTFRMVTTTSWLVRCSGLERAIQVEMCWNCQIHTRFCKKKKVIYLINTLILITN